VTQARAVSTGAGTATASALATGGDGGNRPPSIIPPNTGGTGAAVTLSDVVSGMTTGGTLILNQSAVGGKGGNGEGGGIGGAATSTLTFDDRGNATQSTVLTGTTTATGGNGGSNFSGGFGGTSRGPGGDATAVITLTGVGQVTATSLASGGTGGANTGIGGGGDGGAATAGATATSTGAGPTNATATALGGIGANGFVAGGVGGTATATATATSNGGGPATASAEAVGAQGGTSNSATAASGSALALAGAHTANGQQATAHASASGGSGTASTLATTSGSIINNVTASATSQVGSPAASESRANIARIVSGPDTTGLNSYAFASGLPNNSFVTGALSTHANVGTAFGAAGATVLGTGAQGAFYSADALGSRTYNSVISWEFDTTHLLGHLLVGLLDSSSFGAGFDTLHFEIDEAGSVLLDMTFTSPAVATSFFSDHALDLGTFSTSSPLALDFAFDWTGNSAGTGFGASWLFGAESSVVIAPPPDGGGTRVPEPSTLSLLAIAALMLWVLHVRRLTASGRQLQEPSA